MITVVFYVFFALLILAIFSYGVFWVKAYMESQQIAAIDKKIAVYGSSTQKDHEKEVFDYKKKIDDFAALLASHKMSSNIFTFIESTAQPNVWFSGFTMSESTNEIRLAGEAQDMATLSKQFAVFENSKQQVNDITVLNSQVAPSGRVDFVLNISLNPDIFKYQNGN